MTASQKRWANSLFCPTDIQSWNIMNNLWDVMEHMLALIFSGNLNSDREKLHM